ncbi:MAG: hypothetical protein EZS28_029615, partial [Streblomastix strix]
DVWRHLNVPLPLLQTSLCTIKEGHEQEKEKRLQQKEQKQDDKSKLKTRSSSQGKEHEDNDKRIPIHIPQPQRAVNYLVKEEEEGRAIIVVEQGSELRKEILDSDDQLDKNQSGDANKAINEEIDGSDEKDEDQEENKPSKDA